VFVGVASRRNAKTTEWIRAKPVQSYSLAAWYTMFAASCPNPPNRQREALDFLLLK